VVFSSLLVGALKLSGVHAPTKEVENFLAWSRREPVSLRIAFYSRFFARLLAVVLLWGLTRLRRVLRFRSRLRRLFERQTATSHQFRSPSAPRYSYTWLPGPYFFRAQEFDTLTSYARGHWPDQVHGLIVWGDKLRRGIFPLVSGVEHDFSRGVQWDFPFDDREHLFFLNRFAYAPVLAKAYRYTRDLGYVQMLTALLEDWGSKNPPGHPRTWESYSVSERICNWTLSAHLLQDVAEFREFFAGWLAPQLTRHAEFLAAHLETSAGHNHLVNNARALMTYGVCFPNLPLAAESRELGWNLVCREMPRQTLEDGIFREQSSHYHLLLTRTFTEALLLARLHGLSLPSGMAELLERMYSAMAHMIRPDGSLPYIGDICPDIESCRLTGLLAVGAVLFGRGDFKRPEGCNEHAIWYLGEAGLKEYEKLSAEVAETWARNFPKSGLAALGYRRPEGSAHVLLHADPLGQVVFHGDMGPMGIDIWLNGRSVIRDTGNYGYNQDAWWEYFKGAGAQNTVVVDGVSPWPPPGFRNWLPPAYCAMEAGTGARVEGDGTLLGEAWHSGYQRLPSPLRLRRRVRLYPREGLLITDLLEGSGTHSVEVFFHLGPGRAELEGDLVRLVPDDGLGSVSIWFHSDLPLSVDLAEGWAATAYGRKEPGRVVRVNLYGEIPARVHTAISTNPRWIERIRSSKQEPLGAATVA
jgi:hypothetical protein